MWQVKYHARTKPYECTISISKAELYMYIAAAGMGFEPTQLHLLQFVKDAYQVQYFAF